jgi:hypothetical protein
MASGLGAVSGSFAFALIDGVVGMNPSGDPTEKPNSPIRGAVGIVERVIGSVTGLDATAASAFAAGIISV